MTGTTIYDLAAADYHALERLSASGIKDILRSPAHYRYRKDHGREQSKAMRIGTACHAFVLEPEYAAEFVVRQPKFDRRTKKGREDHAEWSEKLPEGAVVLEASEWDAAWEAAQAVLSDKGIEKAGLLHGQSEVSALFEVEGAECKCRFDKLSERGFAVDLKTTFDASQFERSVARWRYDIQAAFYMMGAAACSLDAKAFVFIAVETSPPYGIRVVTLDSLAMIQGEKDAFRAVKAYKECTESGVWPGYEPGLTTVSLPLYMIDQED